MLQKIALSLVVPALCAFAYRYGVLGGHDVVTGAATAHFGVAFWGLLAIGGLACVVSWRKIWG